MNYLEQIDAAVAEGKLPKALREVFHQFYATYRDALQENGIDVKLLHGELQHFLELVCMQTAAPYRFEPFHAAIRSPFDHYRFGLEFIRPLIVFNKSRLHGEENITRMQEQISSGANVILFANHQGEPDPQVISLMLEGKHPQFAEDMIFVAGHRVVSDPMAIPFSMGRNLLCIYSKKYIDTPPEDREAKLLHNKKTLKMMEHLLSEGGKCIYVAPSGGRDRRNQQGEIEVSAFDPQSIELFSLIAKKAGTKTHFYTLALSTYDVLPPPESGHEGLGERRIAHCTPVHLYFGDEVVMEDIVYPSEMTRHQQKDYRALLLWEKVKSDYASLNLLS